MATETVDLTSLAAVESAAAIPSVTDTPAVGIPASDVPAKVAEPTTETPDKTEAAKVDETKPEVKPEAKPENTVRAELAKKPSQLLPKNVNEALKAFMAENKATPEGVAKLREINAAVAALYTQVAEAKGQAEDVAEVTAAASELEAIVRSNDELLYGSADPAKAARLVENVYTDIVENSTPEAYDGFMSAALDKFKSERPEAYLQHVAGVYHDSLQSTGMTDAVRSLIKAFNAHDQKSLRETISNIKEHIEEIGGITEKQKVAKETSAAAKASEAYHTEQKDACNVQMNKLLAVPFKVMLNTTEAGTFTRPQLLAIATEARNHALKSLASDSLYVKIVNAAFAKKDSAEVARLHKVKVSSVAQASVDKAVKTLYPRGLEPRVAKAAAPKYKTVKTAEGDARVVSSKPAELLRDHKRADVMMLNGRGYIPSPDGKSRILVSWKK